MGRIITINEAQENAPWYFRDAYWNGSSDRYEFEWPSQAFTFHVCMQNNDHRSKTIPKPEIRRWIEHTISDTVIYDNVNLGYRKFYGKWFESDKYYDVTNRWHRFSFEDEYSSTMFTLAFSEYIRPMTTWDPDTPEDEEYLSRPLADRYLKDD